MTTPQYPLVHPRITSGEHWRRCGEMANHSTVIQTQRQAAEWFDYLAGNTNERPTA